MELIPRIRLRAVWLMLAAFAAAASVFVLAASSSAKTPHVGIKPTSSNYRFSPKRVSVGVGHKVKWSWDSDADHNVTFTKVPKGASKRSSETNDRLSFSRSFSKAGSYRYECTIHDFSGTVVAGG
jgi:plastocyanin